MSENGSRISVVVVDRDVFARRGIRALIDAQPDMQVVGEAADCDEAVEIVKTEGARVVIAESKFARKDCGDLLADLCNHDSAVGLIVLTDSRRNEDVLRLIQGGASAYLRKSGPSANLVAAVRAAAEGGHVLEPDALEAVLHDYSTRCHRGGADGAQALSFREREVLTLVAEGMSTKEIAAALGLSHKTVEVHRRRIMDKLQRHKVAHLVRYAVREGLVTLD